MKQGSKIGDKFFCAAPASSLFVDPFGAISACCAGESSFGYLTTGETLEDILTKDTVSNLREDIANGVINSYCNGCKRSELMANDSQRTFYQNIDVNNPREFKLKSLDLRWSSACNFACIYCSEEWSSKWSSLKGIAFNKSENLKRSEEILEFIKKHGADSIEQVLLAGGEPLVQVQNSQLLDILPKDCKIYIITNLGLDLSKSSLFEKLKTRGNVYWAASLENIKGKFEYIRQGGNWTTIESNIEVIQNTPGHRFYFLSVFNILSAWDIEEFVGYVESIGASIAWQTIKDGRDALDPKNFNKKVVNQVIAKLKRIKVPPRLFRNDKFIPQTIKYLQSPSSDINGDKNFRDFISEHESKYNITQHKFKALWPDLNNLIDTFLI